jgi:hypothetical protein
MAVNTGCDRDLLSYINSESTAQGIKNKKTTHAAREAFPHAFQLWGSVMSQILKANDLQSTETEQVSGGCESRVPRNKQNPL